MTMKWMINLMIIIILIYISLIFFWEDIMTFIKYYFENIQDISIIDKTDKEAEIYKVLSILFLLIF